MRRTPAPVRGRGHRGRGHTSLGGTPFVLHAAHLHVETSFRACFNEQHLQLARLGIPLLDGDLPLVDEVSFVAHKNDDYVATPLGPDLLDPTSRVCECRPVWASREHTRGGAQRVH